MRRQELLVTNSTCTQLLLESGRAHHSLKRGEKPTVRVRVRVCSFSCVCVCACVCVRVRVRFT